MITLALIIFLIAFIFYIIFNISAFLVLFILPIIFIKKIYDKKSKPWDKE